MQELVSFVTILYYDPKKSRITVPIEIAKMLGNGKNVFVEVAIRPIREEELHDYGICKIMCPICGREGYVYSNGRGVQIVHPDSQKGLVGHPIPKKLLLSTLYTDLNAINCVVFDFKV